MTKLTYSRDDIRVSALTRIYLRKTGHDPLTVAMLREIFKTVSAEVIRVVMRGDADRRFQYDDFLRQLAKQPERNAIKHRERPH